MTEQEKKLYEKISEYLLHPLDPNASSWPVEQLKEMASWLMEYAPGRYRMTARRLEQAPKSFVIKDANTSLENVARKLSMYGGVTAVEKAVPTMVAKATKTFVETDKIVTQASKSTAGKRLDHETLPDDVKALYEENLPLLQRQRAKFERMKLLYRQMRDQQTSESGAPCDIEETVHQLQEAAQEVVEMNDRRLSNWQKYDSYNATESESTVADEPKVNVQSVNATYVSKNIEKLALLAKQPENRVEYVKLLKKVQQRIDLMESDGWRVEKPRWIELFKEAGVKFQSK